MPVQDSSPRPETESTVIIGRVLPASSGAPSGYGYPQPEQQPYPPQQGGGGSFQQPGQQPAQQPPTVTQQGGPQQPGQQPPNWQQQPQQPSYQQQPSPQQPAYQQPTVPNYASPPAPPQPVSPSGPDWQALAERNESSSRRRNRWWAIGIVGVACVLGIGAGVFIINHTGKKPGPQPQAASGSPSASASSSASPTAAPTASGGPITDRSGVIALDPAADAKVVRVNGGDVLKLNGGVNSFGETTKPVVDVSRSFSVSAWVLNDVASGSRSAISQGNGSYYSFDLGRENSTTHNSWVFKVQTSSGDADNTIYRALAKGTAPAGAWTLLTGTYDAGSHTIALYVNGVLASSTAVPGIWSAPGPLEAGRVRYQGSWTDNWAGVVGDIQIWNRALTPADALGMKNGTASAGSPPVDSWLIN
ncbi:LamG domain-containing protein [Streptacidiphilus sp. EB129]|uniref:LamG domain-containing protein n=1 Tax=Streptacidiphilus sp. EB129 TaxID=3156262 RepID=UPI003517F060